MKNKFMKVFLLFSLALFLSFSFSSCGSSPKEREDEEPELIEQEVIEEIISIHTPIDGQWNIVAFYESGSKNKTYFKGMSSLLLEGEEVIFLYKGQEKTKNYLTKHTSSFSLNGQNIIFKPFKDETNINLKEPNDIFTESFILDNLNHSKTYRLEDSNHLTIKSQDSTLYLER